MRFYSKRQNLEVGDTRIIQRFLLLPKKINGETRWLEPAIIVQEVVEIDVGGSMEWGKYQKSWRDREWFNN